MHQAHPVGDTAKMQKAQRSTGEHGSGETSGTARVSRSAAAKNNNLIYAPVAEQADALDSGSSRGNSVQVRFLSGAPKHSNPNLLPIGETFGFVVFFDDLK